MGMITALALVSTLALSFVPGYMVRNFSLMTTGGVAALWLIPSLLKKFRPAIVVMALYLVLHNAFPYLFWNGGMAPLIHRKTVFLFIVAAAAFSALQLEWRPDGFFEWGVPTWALLTLWGHPLLPFNASLNAALLVAALPFASNRLNFVLVLAVVLFRNDGDTARAMLLVWFALQGLTQLAVTATAVSGYLIGSFFAGSTMHVESDRLDAYLKTWEFFQAKLNPWIGAGLDSFVQLGPFIVGAQDGKDWRSLHSSWGQLLFELGFVGFALGVWLYLDALYHSDEKGQHSLLLLGLCGLFYFPAQVPVMSAFGIWLLMRAQWKA